MSIGPQAERGPSLGGESSSTGRSAWPSQSRSRPSALALSRWACSKGSDADEDVLEPDGVGGDAVASKGLPRGRQNEGFDIIAVSAGPARSGCCVTGQAGHAQIKAALEANGRDREAFRFAAYFTCLLHEDEAMLDRALDHDLSRWHATIWGRINQSDWEREVVSAPMGADWHYAEKLLPVTYREADVAEMIGHATRASNG